MSRFALVRRGRSPLYLPATYDARWGTFTSSLTGWINFDLRPGCRTIWVGPGGSDGANGLSYANRKASFDAAVATLKASFTPGDQIMLAGGATYTDSGDTTNGDLTNYGGFSAAYPTAILSYNAAAPADTTQYGKLTGANMPKLLCPAPGGSFTVSSLSMQSSFGNHYIAVQGVDLDGQNAANAAIRHVNRRDGLIYQNCRFNAVRVTADNESTMGANGRANGMHFSKSAFFGQWDSSAGNSSGLYAAGIDALYVQDCVFAHCGWKVGASRDASSALGGASPLGHSQYYHATSTNAHFDRIVYVDSAADGFNCRGSGAGKVIVSLDEPVAGAIGGFSTDYHEAPDGVLITVDDWLIMGGADLNSSNPRGFGPGITNTVVGSYLRKLAMFDNPILGGVNNDNFRALHLGLNGSGSNVDIPIDIYCTIDQVHGRNYATTNFQTTNGDSSKIHMDYQNCVTDLLAPGAGNTTSSAGTFAGYQTRDQVVTAILTAAGITPGANYTARKAQLVNLMLWRPDVQWAQPFVDVGLPAMGLTPSFAAGSLPNLSAESPASVY
jgi:hypothetical protein